MDDPVDDRENLLVKLTSLGVLGLGLAGLFLGFEWFWAVFAVGFAVVVPLVKLVSKSLGVGDAERDHRPNRTARDRTAGTESKRDALDELRSRYARGDLSDAEFERKVETLLETETPESARKHVERETETETDR
ncbi:SHOCT domain-containing protein [Halorussus lipolyticus]|uniref:SHOCT domain-containing protein n=1 Tax=Halorussus lipolyticus TaxID=3034024 RepID=UPI0023E83DE9|nr:SHOCT domain-containing protein [Halorussus sp. DT80]